MEFQTLPRSLRFVVTQCHSVSDEHREEKNNDFFSHGNLVTPRTGRIETKAEGTYKSL